ncbi:MAG TPA: exosortase/archaeosortase family protein [Candidatus Limnocylindrales bacterium]|jgi:exosortase|nr:exosortase/archaeosortase family protein [Candidatus Limnocylindrales bacterium]
MDHLSGNGVLEEFRIEVSHCWQKMPNKVFFFVLLASWIALFHFLGNSTFGYAPTPSLLVWMYDAFTRNGQDLLNSDEAYGLLIPFVVLALFWWKRRELLSLELRVWPPGLALVATGLGFHVLGYLVQQPRLSIIGMFTGVYGLIGLAWGPASLKASTFPFFLFVFCIPLGSLVEPITFRLRLLVSQLVVLISHFILAIDVERDGTILMDATRHYQYEVAAACSGIRSLLATFALAVILAFVSLRKPWKRLVMIASAVPLAVMGNLLRMLAIIIAAELGGQEWGNRVHEGGPFGIFSLLPYVPAFLGLLVLEYYLREPTPLLPPPTLAHQHA